MKATEPSVLNEAPKNIIQKLAEIVGEIGATKPEGVNPHFRYKYYSDEQISSLFRDKFAKRNLVLVPTVLSCDVLQTGGAKPSFLTTLRVQWDIWDGDFAASDLGVISGSMPKITAVTVGQGDDPGDKGANKAMTGAFKYLLIKMGMIGGEGDAEADAATDARHEGQERPQKARVSTPESPVQGVQKGGRQKGSTEPQVDQVSRLAKELGIGFDGLINVIKNVLNVDLELPEDQEDRKKMMRAFFDNLTSEEMGQILQRLTEAKERQSTSLPEGM